MKNFFDLPATGPQERFEDVLAGERGFRLERIVSYGQATPLGIWYDQETDEWVLILTGAARIAYEDGREIHLAAGDHLFLPRRVKHRVTYTSSPCLWLAVHGDALATAT